MKDDLSDVSGQTVTINADIQSMSDEVKISGINISSASMSVDGYKLLTENGKGIIAVYNTDGTIGKGAYIGGQHKQYKRNGTF